MGGWGGGGEGKGRKAQRKELCMKKHGYGEERAVVHKKKNTEGFI